MLAKSSASKRSGVVRRPTAPSGTLGEPATASLIERESAPLVAVAKLIGVAVGHCIGQSVAIGKGSQDSCPSPGHLSLDEVLARRHLA